MRSLAKASGPTFSVPVTIPSVPDGLYAVVVVERRPDGSIGSTGSTAFLVTGAHEPPAAGTSASTSSSTLAESPPRSSRGGAATPVAFGGGIALGGVAGAVVVRGRRRR